MKEVAKLKNKGGVSPRGLKARGTEDEEDDESIDGKLEDDPIDINLPKVYQPSTFASQAN
jgi:hypothetical protein